MNHLQRASRASRASCGAAMRAQSCAHTRSCAFFCFSALMASFFALRPELRTGAFRQSISVKHCCGAQRGSCKYSATNAASHRANFLAVLHTFFPPLLRLRSPHALRRRLPASRGAREEMCSPLLVSLVTAYVGSPMPKESEGTSEQRHPFGSRMPFSGAAGVNINSTRPSRPSKRDNTVDHARFQWP